MLKFQLMKAKRKHWGIENSLHLALDMAFRKDDFSLAVCRINGII